MKISIVIPVYNEADHLGVCLSAIADQTKKAYEVIVVDNNSTDGTKAVAQSFDFVTLINEPKQGVVHARATGFNQASGDVIARLDGDSILPPDWVSNVAEVFKDQSIDAASGVALYYNVAADYIFNYIDLYFRRRLSKQLKSDMYLWGANMAMRHKAWRQVRGHLCMRGDMHEDYDVAIHLQELGKNVVFDERLVAQVSSRRIDSDFISFMRYVWKSPSTYAQHDKKVLRYMMPIVITCAVGYLPARILHKGYDPLLDRFSVSHLLEPSTAPPRVDPTIYVA